MKKMMISKYDAPSVEVIEVEVESGFSASAPDFGGGGSLTSSYYYFDAEEE